MQNLFKEYLTIRGKNKLIKNQWWKVLLRPASVSSTSRAAPAVSNRNNLRSDLFEGNREESLWFLSKKQFILDSQKVRKNKLQWILFLCSQTYFQAETQCYKETNK